MAGAQAPPAPRVVVGSKAFTESVVLGEILTHLAHGTGAEAVHRKELGSTRILWNALRDGAVDAYVEYTGTIIREIMAQDKNLTAEALPERLLKDGIRISPTLGFNNSYAIGIKKEKAQKLGLTKLSELARHPELRLGLSNEFLDRADGWPALRQRYGLPHKEVRGLIHDLAYRAIENGAIDLTDLYSTDAEINQYGLALLQDDRQVFPAYHAVILFRAELESRAPRVVTAFLSLAGQITEAEMVAMNAKAKLARIPESQVATEFLSAKFKDQAEQFRQTEMAFSETVGGQLLTTTAEHLFLVVVSLAAAICLALPLGILAHWRPTLGGTILAAVGVIQTIPSLALLVLIMAILPRTIGTLPAMVALFLYSLLPIVANTHAGLKDIPLSIRESAEALGLAPLAQLWMIELPMAAGSIVTGIKTAAVINVGTATLGGLIGAGGYGQTIIRGIRLDNVGMILQGAVPAAVLALAVQGLFALIERWVVPKGLRLTPQ